ncbi:hypothetical protein JCM19237_6052 [Photobacterium aphoticum]|uniref:Uncharacterized protein n=1 Tax=Photobacterium aphoticum TaxID=754436 RepID=A0A090QMW7_9GAMM|nr:hypothetical protein JCM19237_6052 [Photobacterium aphoticum]
MIFYFDKSLYSVEESGDLLAYAKQRKPTHCAFAQQMANDMSLGEQIKTAPAQ